MAKKLIDKSIPRFLMVGVLNTLVGAGVMFLLFNLAGWAYWTTWRAGPTGQPRRRITWWAVC